jgi:putative transposase
MRVGRRRSIRLWEYDYRRDGAYFLTMCAHNRRPLFGSILNGHVRLSSIGQIVRECWCEIPHHFSQARLDRFVIMPDHLHGVLILEGSSLHPGPRVQREFGTAIRGSLATIVGAFKSSVTRRLRQQGMKGHIWQRNYYEHVIRNDDALWAIRRYIVTNPHRWRNGRNT